MRNSTPLFSIVIPTRNRAHLLPFALRSALEQEFDDYEIVVIANDCSDNTRDVVREMGGQRVHYYETPTMLSMPDNWEFAWTKARGSYVTYLSDDDALVPTAFSLLTRQAMDEAPLIISWEDATYYYPDWHDAQLRNLLLVFFHSDDLIEDVSTDVYRKLCARFEFPWQSTLPKMLNCVAHRESLEGWRTKLGRLFPPICPDYSFAWIASHAFEHVRVVHRPLSVRGISDHSIGSNAGLGDAGKGFIKEFGDVDFFSGLPTRVPTTMNLLAATFLRCNAMLAEQGISHEPFDRSAYLLALAKQLREPESEALLPNLAEYFPELLTAAAQISNRLHEEVAGILTAPHETVSSSESIRDVRARTARMALEYAPTLANATREHLGDDACARCVLGLADGALANTSWDSLYVFGDEIGVADPYGASRHVDHFYDLMMNCREKRRQALDRAATVRTAQLSGDTSDYQAVLEQEVQRLRDEILAKERVIVELKVSADERLRLLYEADADAKQARTVSDALTAQLQEKVDVIVSLAASADERLSLVDQAHAEATNARSVAEELVAQLREKDQLIGALSAAADERLGLVDRAAADASNARIVADQLISQLREKDELIVALSASADERLSLLETSHSEVARVRTRAEQLEAQLHERDLLIEALTASADERLRLLDEATAAAEREREASEALTRQLTEKEQLIAELTTVARERLRVARESSDEAERARVAAEQMALQLQEKEQVIALLSAAASERLELIERLNREMAQGGASSTPHGS